MKAYASLWSADLLNVGSAIDVIDAHTDGFHIDITDGHFTRQLLFGPDFVAAVRQRTQKVIDVHLMVEEADYWAPIFIEAGADMVTVHQRSTPDLARTISTITELGAAPSLAIELDEALPTDGPAAAPGIVRHLLMGTAIGIKGSEPSSATIDRVQGLVAHRACSGSSAEVWVDGGIRHHTVPQMATAGADGVIPGSLVYGADDAIAALNWLHSLGPVAPLHQALM